MKTNTISVISVRIRSVFIPGYNHEGRCSAPDGGSQSRGMLHTVREKVVWGSGGLRALTMQDSIIEFKTIYYILFMIFC
jgi:hypothetical protein